MHFFPSEEETHTKIFLLKYHPEEYSIAALVGVDADEETVVWHDDDKVATLTNRKDYGIVD